MIIGWITTDQIAAVVASTITHSMGISGWMMMMTVGVTNLTFP